MFAATTTGWTGADGTFSLRLPDGDTAWLFGDTFLAGLTGAGGRDQPFPDVRNTVVVQDDECLTTLFRGTLAEPLDFEPAEEEERWHWINQPVVHGDEIRVFLTRMRREGDFYAVDGTVLATYDLDLERVGVGPDLPSLPAQWWGAAIVDDEPYTYVFGIRDQPRSLLLARTPFQDLDGAWEYRTAAGWSDELEDAQPVLAGVATQLSVLRDGDGWLLVSQDPYPGRDVHLWSATEPWSWGAPQTLTTLPEVENGSTYNALAHPQFASDDGLLLSYNVIASTPQLTMQDAALYRPRFVRVPLP